MLHVHPEVLPRLDVIEADLHARRDRAHGEGWLGEIEGIDLTLSHLQAKRRQAVRLVEARAVPLGLPTVRTGRAKP